MTNREMTKAAREIETATEEMLDKGTTNFKDDAAMINMFRDDARDLRQVADWLREGRLDYALATAMNLDTAARDEIPGSVWNLMVNGE